MEAISELAYIGFGVGAGKIIPEAAIALFTPITVGIQFLQTS